MINIKESKGITLVALIVTIIVLLILTGTGIYNYRISNETAYYNKMVSDIKLLNDKILVYYNKYEEIPKTDIQDRQITINGTVYYEIDLSKLDVITLNYGKEYGETVVLSNSADVYVVNANLNVYYLQGTEKNGEIYHTK